MAYACTGRSTSTKFWKFLWHNSGRKPNQLNMDCGGLGVQGAMVQVRALLVHVAQQWQET